MFDKLPAFDPPDNNSAGAIALRAWVRGVTARGPPQGRSEWLQGRTRSRRQRSGEGLRGGARLSEGEQEEGRGVAATREG